MLSVRLATPFKMVSMSPWTKGMSFSAPWFAAASSSSVGSSMHFSSMGVSGSGWKSSSRLHSGSSLVSSGLSEKVISASLSVAVSAWLPLAESAFAASASSAYAFSGPNETGKAAVLVFALPAASATTGGSSRSAQRPKTKARSSSVPCPVSTCTKALFACDA